MIIPLRPGAVPPSAPSTPLEARDDDELMLLARAGNGAAFDMLVRRYQRLALRVAAKVLGSSVAAQDAAQSAFLDVYAQLPRYRPLGRFRFYLQRVLLNRCRMALRRARHGANASSVLATEAREVPASAEDQILADERRREVERSLLEVPPKLRDVLVLRFVSDMSLDEIGLTLEIPVGTVKSRLSAGIAKLRAAVEVSP